MMSQEKLTVALVLALISNATLLLLLLLKSSDFRIESVCHDDPEDVKKVKSGTRSSNFGGDQVDKQEYKYHQPKKVNSGAENMLQSESSGIPSGFTKTEFDNTDENIILNLLKMKSSGFDDSEMGNLLQGYRDVLEKNRFSGDFEPVPEKLYQNRPTSSFTRKFKQNTSSWKESFSALSELLIRSILKKPTSTTFSGELMSSQGSLKPGYDAMETTTEFSKTSKQEDTSRKDLSKTGNRVLFDNRNQSASVQFQPAALHSLVVSKRERRHAFVDPSGEAVKADATTRSSAEYKLDTIFSQMTEKEMDQFQPAVSDILLPALFHFEGMLITEIEKLHNTLVGQDLRLEELEHTMLNIAKRQALEPQSDAEDNKSLLDNLQHVLDEGFLSAGNISETLQLETDGSGEVELEIPTTSTSPPPTTTTQSVVLNDLYRMFNSMEQKVLALENYNVMSDSELTRVRSEVIKMDDKVTEMDRRQRNMQIRTSMHTYKITELEMMMSKNEFGIHSTLDAYTRVNSRLEAFKDRLSEFKSDLHSVEVQFSRQDQISNELRAADSYKAHDIQEMRKNVFGLETRLNGLYRVLDQNVDAVRNDLRTMLDRLCFNNQLAC